MTNGKVFYIFGKNLGFFSDYFILDFSICMTIISIMGKKNLTKSSDQKESLETFYRRKPSGWKRE
jgi:hypothetical protein